MEKRILITGGGGFIGQLLSQTLEKEKHTVFSKRFDVTDALETKKVLEQFGPEIIVHLASPTDLEKCESDARFAEKCIFTGTQNILRNANDCRLVFASSSLVYDEPKTGTHEINETWPIKPATNYGKAKAKAESLVNEWTGKKIVLRIFPHTHKTQKANRFLSKIFNKISENKQVTLENSLKNHSRDIGAARDLVKALFNTCQSDVTGTYNVCSGKARNLGSLAEIMAKKLGGEIHFKGDPSVENSYFGNYRKLSTAIQWQPTVIKDEDLIEYYLSEKAL